MMITYLLINLTIGLIEVIFLKKYQKGIYD